MGSPRRHLHVMARVTPGFAARSHEAPADDQRDAERDLALEDLDDADDDEQCGDDLQE